MSTIDFLGRFRDSYRAKATGTQRECYLCTMEIAGETRPCLFLHPPHRVDFEIVNADLYLTFSIAISPQAWELPGAGACRFSVLVDGHEQFARVINPTVVAEERRWLRDGLIVSRSHAASVRTITFQTSGVGSIDCRWALWGEPAAVVLDSLPKSVDVELAAAIADREIERLRSQPARRLNLGCGGFPLTGWTNIDGGDAFFSPPDDATVVRLDVFRALGALASDSVEFITSEQFLEHFTRQDGLRLMQECWRVLRPGGVMRVQVPDLEQVIRLYRNEVPEADWETVQLPHRMRHIHGSRDPYGKLQPGEQYTPAMMINNGFHLDGHRFLYDFQTLAQSLRLAGFQEIIRERFGESRHAELRGVDRHDGGPTGRAWVPMLALTVEATK